MLKSGLLSANAAFDDDKLSMINQAHGSQLVAACQACAQNLLDTAWFKLEAQVKAKKKSAEGMLTCIPLASIPSPHGWSYQTLGLVTAQSVSGTGLFSDVTSAFTDLFGA